MTYTSTFPIEFAPVPDPDAAVSGPNVRFTVLASRLLRLEFSPTGAFEDRPSQAFWHRRHPVPKFTAEKADDHITVETDHLRLTFNASDGGFTAETLSILVKDLETLWHYGQEDPLNLAGTFRTLDGAEGGLSLEQGLISRSGWAVFDDSASLVFGSDGWPEPRNAPVGTKDLYFFGYGHDYYGCLRDFTAIAGKAPLIPRWILGNWWSRYWRYAEKELLGLMDEFRANNVPLSVCIVDMDWHVTDTGNSSSGWTGYTWNRELFPDPPGFIDQLHQRGLRTALNLHPAAGVHPHEAQYKEMAKRVGIDPDTDLPVLFDIADPAFTVAYFDLLHHPYERDGVDFWWLDWQQGAATNMPGLDPLWWLNHLHYYDLGRGGDKRPFIFSRWGGLGNHRYPIGFSGDTVVSWESLAFQPFFTATAANVNYGWWSHDIGGHMSGVEDPELYARWIQFGVFSPILRMHCTNNPFHERRPWAFDAETEKVASSALRLRHALIPYLYTQSWRNHAESVPLIRPMYYDHPGDERAYHCPDQYCFGSEFVVAPFVTPADNETRLSRQVVWLPQGEWFGFFDGLSYPGDSWHPVYGTLEDIPVFARAGAIVPLSPEVGWGGVDNPDSLDVHLFPGGDNSFSLFEDDGLETQSFTPILQTYGTREWEVRIEPARGKTNHLPATRAYSLLFRSLPSAANVAVRIDGKAVSVDAEYVEATCTLRLSPMSIAPSQTLSATVALAELPDDLRVDYRLVALRKMVRRFRMNTWVKARLYEQISQLMENHSVLADYELKLSSTQMQAVAETLTGAGVHQSASRRGDEELTVMWNNREAGSVSFDLAAIDLAKHPVRRAGRLPKFGVATASKGQVHVHWGTEPATPGELASPAPENIFRSDRYKLNVTYLDAITLHLGSPSH